MKFSNLKNTLLVAGAALAVAAPAFSQNTSFTMTNDFTQDGTVYITDNGGSSYEDVYAGRYSANVGGTTEDIFCVDPAHEINGGATYEADVSQDITNPAGTLQTSGPTAGYYNGGLTSAMTTADLNPQNLTTVSGMQRSEEVAYLADDYLNATATTFTGSLSGSTSLNTNETGVQLAIWDIITDGGYANGNYLTGDFGLQSGTSSTDVNEMDYYLQQADEYGTSSSSLADWIQAPITTSNGVETHLQDFVAVPGGTVGTPTGLSPVPEPSLGAFLFSLAVAGGIMLLIKRRSAVIS